MKKLQGIPTINSFMNPTRTLRRKILGGHRHVKKQEICRRNH